MKWCHFFSTLMCRYCNILCSTALVTDHANPAVKSIVILRFPKYKLLIYKNMPINVTEEYSETFFRLKNLKMCHLIWSWKAMVLISNAMWYLQMNVWKKNKNPFRWWGWLSGVRRTSVLSTSTNLEIWIKCLVLQKVEGGHRGKQGYLLSKTYNIFSSKNSASCLTTHTYCKTWPCPYALFVDIHKFDFL